MFLQRLSGIHSYGSERIAIIRRSLRHRKSPSKDVDDNLAEVNDNIMADDINDPQQK